MENLEANSESTQPETLNTEGNETDPDHNTNNPGRQGRKLIEALKRLWKRIFNNR
ncbi:hypothetical protein [Nostoc sp.]|uniref:hypothetical protein n=1 Tax=Nostoc sp. TaxID=1180 RepID=UPI002FFA4CE4